MQCLFSVGEILANNQANQKTFDQPLVAAGAEPDSSTVACVISACIHSDVTAAGAAFHAFHV